MTFGEALREARTSRGWSRAQTEIIITARFKAFKFTLTDDAIKLIEYGISEPRETTRRILEQLFPELTTKISQTESIEAVSTAR